MYINNVPIFIPMPSSSSNGKGGKSGNNKFFVYGIFLLVVGVSVTILFILLDLFFDVGLLFHPKVSLVGILWLLIMFCLFSVSVFYKNQTDKEIFESIGRDLIRLCNLGIIGFVAVIIIMIYDIVTQKEVITQTTSNIIMGSAMALNIIKYIVYTKIKKNTKKNEKKEIKYDIIN